MLMENAGKNNGAVSKKTIWRRIWAMPVSRKWKFFIWRIFHKALALCSNLEKRGVITGKRYGLCLNERENEEHLFRDC